MNKQVLRILEIYEYTLTQTYKHIQPINIHTHTHPEKGGEK